MTTWKEKMEKDMATPGYVKLGPEPTSKCDISERSGQEHCSCFWNSDLGCCWCGKHGVNASCR